MLQHGSKIRMPKELEDDYCLGFDFVKHMHDERYRRMIDSSIEATNDWNERNPHKGFPPFNLFFGMWRDLFKGGMND